MNKKIALVLYAALGIVSLVLLVMTVLASAGVSNVWKGMPIVIVLFVFAIALLVSLIAFNPKKLWYSIGFYALHAGIVLFLVGTFVYTVSGTATNAAPPSVSSFTATIEYRMKQMGITDDQIANMKGYYNQVSKTDENGTAEVIDLGFNFRIVDFVTEYYDEAQTSVKHYEATVGFLKSDGTEEKVSLTVNHPIYRNGWKIYLMNVSENQPFGYTEVQLLFKKDPTEFLSTSGIILTVIGTFMMCFLRPSEAMLSKKRSAQAAKKNGKKQGGKAS
ncbi:MAG: cytochrome c biogenesis protein ResB [Clostridia bacterium]|nr:cytochrome c biogenesis protein ResB [Clostridia bacterium]